MPSNAEKSQLFSAFKAILKKRRISYRALAKLSGNSESSIKRMFSIEECSLEKILHLLNSIELSLSDLIEFINQSKVDRSTFSLEAEQFLSEALEYFYLYRKLQQFGDVERLRKQEGLSKSEMTKYLKKLDDLNVIQWLSKDRVKFSTAEFLEFRDDGPLQEAVYKDWTPKFLSRVLDNLKSSDHSLRLYSTSCSGELQESFHKEFSELVERFLKRASLEKKTSPKSVKSFGLALATGPIRVGLDEPDQFTLIESGQ